MFCLTAFVEDRCQRRPRLLSFPYVPRQLQSVARESSSARMVRELVTPNFGSLRWCGRPDSNRHRSLNPTDFLTTSAFAAVRLRMFVVWTIPSPCPDRAPGVRCCPSSLYTFPFPGLARDCPSQVSPNLSSSASPVSRRALKISSSPLRPTEFATPARRVRSLYWGGKLTF